jgi:UDP-N-acetylmuramyl tripeptide synthase
MTLRNFFSIFVAKALSKTLKTLSLGSGSTWPGHIALKLSPGFIHDVTAKNRLKIILVAGTNGKTTTSTLLKFLLEKNGKKVFQNAEGANLENGVASTLLKHISLTGTFSADYAIFEVDENSLPKLLKQLTPEVLIVLNLFRDQLDRYGEVNTIARNWKESFQYLDTSVKLVLNGDDPQIAFLGEKTPATVYYFGASEEVLEKKEIPHDVDSVYCPNCGKKLFYTKMSYSHLGDFECKNCGFKRKNVTTYPTNGLKSQLKGVYNYYNISAVFLTLEKVLLLDLELLLPYVMQFKPAFGRQEIISYKNKNVFLLLSKNPTGFNQSIAAIQNTKKEKNSVLIILNDRIPDGRDISWIWDVEFEDLLFSSSSVVVSGDRAYDMALRLKYCYDNDVSIENSDSGYSFEKVFVVPELSVALNKAVSNTKENEMLYILATYSGMLDVRKLLIGKKLL